MRTTGRFPVRAVTRATTRNYVRKPCSPCWGRSNWSALISCAPIARQDKYPADPELGIAGLESSPGVRRMEAVVGSEMPFAPGCEPLKLLAGLDVTAKAI